MRSIFIFIWLFFVTTTPLPAQETCAIELVIAIDVSRSVSSKEFDLIRHGTAEAFRHVDVASLVTVANGGILVAVMEWSGPDEQQVMIPWRHLVNPISAHALANEIDGMARVFSKDLTAPGDALIAAESLGSSAPMTCARRVIDISGDGVRNTGGDTGNAADEVARKGVTINGLVIRGASPDPVMFYKTDIQRGALSFVELSENYDDFPHAMFRKLLRELTPSVSLADRLKKPG